MAELISNAEKFADQSRNLTQFKNFSLPGVKDKVSAILNMIGRVEGIFSTYTIHSIEHVDEMLKSLDWLIPPDTQKAMTSVDWLMIVLSVYLHDLGMVVTSEEYKKRMENQKFTEFLDNLQTNPANKDYMARVEKFEGEDRERFFYQEYIRWLHASRIRELIHGRSTGQWGETIKPIFDEIADIMKDLPPRFKENLGNVCESHHADNLDKREYFPLHQHYGGTEEASANVQYAALILRTADLLHVTKDRTPSVMYKILGLSDPKGVDEWKKQMGTFSVYRAGRVFDSSDKASHVIEIGADFTEERPFFALTEYLSYVRQQIEQTKGWADSSQQTPDAKDYWFPWHSIKGNVLVEGHEPVPMKFELDRGRLLDLLVGHTIYNDATVAVRELLQNAIDAVRYQHYLEEREYKNTGRPSNPMGKVTIKWNSIERVFTVEDNGIGMDRNVITSHLMRVGASFYNTPQFQQEYKDYTPISRFGIGILTNFMVSDDIEIVTYKSGIGYRIRLTSVQSDYLLKKIESGDSLLKDLEPHGTRITVKVRSSVDFKDRTMLDIVKYWIILPACEVYFKEDDKEPTLIGFKTIADALSHYHKEPKEMVDRYGVKISQESVSYDIRSVSYSTEKGVYDFAFKVNKGFTPEWRLVETQGKNDAPVVCIEGIRADNVLPGFTSRGVIDEFTGNVLGALCTLLSVRGNKDFRTTVSRTSLERDEEYLRVGKICADFLLGHLKDEVNRIAKSSGSPLSRASSAGKYIYQSISKRINEDTKSYLLDTFKNIPIIVVEKVGKGINPVSIRRELISPKDLQDIEEFWTIESRLVFYLGTISRDLGKELSLNEFLGTLAPELRDPRITVLVPDAHEFKEQILSSHIVSGVEFSRLNQQTMVSWIPKKDAQKGMNIQRGNQKITNLDALLNSVRDSFSVVSISEDLLLRMENMILKDLSGILAAPIKGDLKAIRGVNTKAVTVLENETSLSLAWFTLLTIINEYPNDKPKNEEYYWAVLGVATLLVGYGKNDELMQFFGMGRYYGRRQQRVTKMMREVWNEVVNHLEKNVFDKANLSIWQALDLSEIMGDDDNWFDASSYWWNW